MADTEETNEDSIQEEKSTESNPSTVPDKYKTTERIAAKFQGDALRDRLPEAEGNDNGGAVRRLMGKFHFEDRMEQEYFDSLADRFAAQQTGDVISKVKNADFAAFAVKECALTLKQARERGATDDVIKTLETRLKNLEKIVGRNAVV